MPKSKKDPGSFFPFGVLPGTHHFWFSHKFFVSQHFTPFFGTGYFYEPGKKVLGMILT
jgi:hypothetical protein